MKLKEIFVMTIVILLSGASVFANDGQTQQQMNQQITDVDIGQYTSVEGPGYSESSAEGGEASASAGAILVFDPTTNSYVKYPSYKVQAVYPGQAPLPWPFPSPPWFWNSWPNGLTSVFQREWTKSEVYEALKHIPYKGLLEHFFLSGGAPPEEGKGFKWRITLNDYKPRPKIKTKFTTLTQDVNMSAILKDFTWIGSINVMGKEGLTIDQTVRCGVKLALRYDLDLGILVPGMNPVNNAMGFSPGVGWNTAGVHNNFALITSLSGGKAVVRGEPGVVMYVFRKNGAPKLPEEISETALKPVKPVKEEKPPGVEVNEELWQKAKEIRN